MIQHILLLLPEKCTLASFKVSGSFRVVADLFDTLLLNINVD